jgi:hypothetical protein
MKYYYLTDNSEKSLTPFFSKMVLSASFVIVVIVSILVLIFWPRQPLAGFMIAHKIPLGFFLISGAVLIVCGYVNLSCGCGEMIARHYFARYRTDISTFEKEIDFFQYGLIEFLLHTLILLLPFLPLLILAASISVASFITFIKAVSILYSASLLFRLFGFMVYLFWGRLSSLGYFTARLFMVVFVFGTLLFLPHINPLQVLYDLNERPDAIAWPFVLYMAFVIFTILLLIAANHKLVGRHIKQEKTT